MKSVAFLALIAVLLGLSSCAESEAISGAMLGGSAAGAAYSDITFWWRCEGTTFSGTDDHSAGDDTPTANSAVAINTNHPMVGANAIEVPSGGDSYSFASASIVDGSSGTLAFWWHSYLGEWASGQFLFRIETGSGDYLALAMYETDRLRFYWNGTTFTTTATYLVATDYFIQVAFDVTTNTVQLIVNNSADIDTTGTAISALTVDTIYWGSEGGGADYYIDNIMVSNDFERDFYPLRATAAYPG